MANALPGKLFAHGEHGTGRWWCWLGCGERLGLWLCPGEGNTVVAWWRMCDFMGWCAGWPWQVMSVGAQVWTGQSNGGAVVLARPVPVAGEGGLE